MSLETTYDAEIEPRATTTSSRDVLGCRRTAETERVWAWKVMVEDVAQTSPTRRPRAEAEAKRYISPPLPVRWSEGEGRGVEVTK